ncbi:hypothetical protein DPMN_193168 [Dreissena polymorpha]|uniref:G-protein coupled receptors family 1 profile domain-containing protein n=1 Tax=Dreissena polymorpha TaxID=45954 RepID=A0A9D3Y3P8_DREPO|nr:hypothetical protein DPMN_193168 [Dreissena polymorpha]
MVVVIALTFIASWTPFYLVNIISQLQHDSFLRKSNFIFTMLITHFCGFINSCLNPIIYTAMSQKFRRSFIDIIKRIWYCFTCNASGKSRLRYGVSHRFTSTLHHTLTETDAHHVALQELEKCNGSLRRPKADSKSSSSGTDPEVRQLKTDENTLVKKYICKDNRTDSQCGDYIDHSINDQHEFKPQRKGILKIKADLAQATSLV